MVGDPTVVSKIKDATVALEVKGPTGAEIKSRWKKLVSRLHTGVGVFAALPSADPGCGDAAFRLFLHTRDPHDAVLTPSWPKPVATRLGIAVTEATE